MAKDFMILVRRPADLLKALGRIAVGGAMAATGVSAASPSNAASTSSPTGSTSLTPLIVDRHKKAPKVLLQIPGVGSAYISPDHRSHRSHSSHRSHFSSSGGTATPARPPARQPPARQPAAALPATLALEGVSGEVTGIDKVARTITVKQSETVTATYAYRDDSKFETAIGVNVRFDDFANENAGRVPVARGQKVHLTWRTSTGVKTRIITTIKINP